MDLAPGLIPSLFVLRDPGYNVAYWNLSSREVRRADGGYTVNALSSLLRVLPREA
jgi:hypothetical protein